MCKYGSPASICCMFRVEIRDAQVIRNGVQFAYWPEEGRIVFQPFSSK